jgi:(1->4)-alpha-D-glucan 1-alpha-D-glucosylmutase
VEAINGSPGDPASFDALHELLEDQPFRLAYWCVASDEINYRRFFDINELAALRIEESSVFDATHAFIVGLAAEGAIGGLRIDHIDGLFDPAAYLARLQRRYRERVAEQHTSMIRAQAGIYVVVEKICATHERLPEAWPVFGTTGYCFASAVNGLFVDTRAKARLDRGWRAFVGSEALAFEAEARRSRRAIMEGPLASALAALALRALRIARADRRTRDFTFNTLREAIKDIVACFPVYRTYVDANGPSPQDRRYVDWAVARARRESRIADITVFDFLHAALLGERPAGASASEQSYRDFAMRAQQFTAPVAAKGIEDTAFYRFNRLVSLNEVGGDPERFGLSVRAFHGAGADCAALWPHTMLATSTHDNKRSEDVRARIDVISELPAAWRLAVRRWSRINRSRKRLLDGVPAPSRNDEYLLYQTLIGTFPVSEVDGTRLAAYRERIERYMVKAAREAKVHTSWLAVNRDYEDALVGFVGALLRTAGENRFLAELRTQTEIFAWFGMLNSVAMTLIKFASPGVPDVYQGTELLDDSLVDPDNRRPVDYAQRRARLAELDALQAELAAGRAARVGSLFDSPFDGRAKLWVIVRALALRRAHHGLFAQGDYRPIAATGARAQNVLAFARSFRGELIIAAAGRLFASLRTDIGTPPVGDVWRETVLDLSWLKSPLSAVNVLTGESHVIGSRDVPLDELFRHFPGALLHLASPAGHPA